MVPVSYYVGLSAILFSIGACGCFGPQGIRSSSSCLWNSCLNRPTWYLWSMPGLTVYGVQIFVFFIMSVAAAEVAVGLALIVAIFHTKHNIDIDALNNLKG